MPLCFLVLKYCYARECRAELKNQSGASQTTLLLDCAYSNAAPTQSSFDLRRLSYLFSFVTPNLSSEVYESRKQRQRRLLQSAKLFS